MFCSTQTCATPVQADATAKGFNQDPDSGVPGSPTATGGSLTYSCATGGHEVGSSGSSTLTVTCGAATKASDPWWEAKWDQEVSAWDACAAPAKRKKRDTSEFHSKNQKTPQFLPW